MRAVLLTGPGAVQTQLDALAGRFAQPAIGAKAAAVVDGRENTVRRHGGVSGVIPADRVRPLHRHRFTGGRRETIARPDRPRRDRRPSSNRWRYRRAHPSTTTVYGLRGSRRQQKCGHCPATWPVLSRHSNSSQSLFGVGCDRVEVDVRIAVGLHLIRSGADDRHVVGGGRVAQQHGAGRRDDVRRTHRHSDRPPRWRSAYCDTARRRCSNRGGMSRARRSRRCRGLAQSSRCPST